MKEIISKAFTLLLFCGCSAFVAFRGHECFKKFLSQPQHVEFSYIPSKEIPFPAFTFCLENKNFEDLTSRLEKLDIVYQDLTVNQIESQDLNLTKNAGLGYSLLTQCVSLILDREILKFGIKRLHFKWKNRTQNEILRLNVHHPSNGFLWMPVGSANIWQAIDTQSYSVLGLEFEVLNLLRYQDAECNLDVEYNFDKCLDEYIYNQSMKILGCTSSLGLNEANICGSGKEKMALELVKNLTRKSSKYNEIAESCLYPCQSMSVQIKEVRKEPNPYFTAIAMNHYIKVTTFKHSYTELELLAELGGYVGLFLGILSVFQLRDLSNKILNHLYLP